VNTKTLDKKSIDNLLNIINEFHIIGRCSGIFPIGSGHINDSYLVETDTPGNNYVLQKINHHIFKDIPGLIQNIHLVTTHLAAKIQSGDPAASGLSPLTLIQENKGKSFHQEKNGSYWRLYNYIHSTKSYDLVTDPLLAYEGGNAFGRFQYLTSDLDT
jgi:hypothetical protein